MRDTLTLGRFGPGYPPFALLVLVAGMALVAGCGSDEKPPPPPMERGVIVLGIDGMDYTLAQRFMREGKMPNLKRLADKGHFKPLGTTDPPQSPVAWSSFITGLDPHQHGIYDFVHRDVESLEPYLSTTRVHPSEDVWAIGDMQLALDEPEIESMREGTVWWELLESEDIPVTVFKVPANFPPEEHWVSRTMSGMGTPDILGTYGTFQVFTEDPAWAERDSVSGGIVHHLEFDGQHAETTIEGPPDPYTVGTPPLTIDLEVVVDQERDVSLLRFGDAEVILVPGDWTGWYPLSFDAGLLFGSVPGIARFYLKSVRPLTIYMSPINLDPTDPLMPISSPRSYSAEVARDTGRYYTQGMPEDTKALAANVLSDAEFLQLADSIFKERLRLLDWTLEHYRGGVLFFYFSSLDQVCHVFWRTLDVPDDHPLAEHRDTIPKLYQEMDRMVGEVLDRAPEGTEVVIVSDHGFAPYTWKVNLNTWLHERGYLSVLPPDQRGKGPLGHIDWSRTQAYALGLNQLFINLEGREPKGIVSPDEVEVLTRRLERDLLGWRDPNTGRSVVSNVSRPSAATHPERSPDLIVGYARGYRSSDTSAMGVVGGPTIERNEDKWSGDHCMDPSVVPGVLFSTIPLRDGQFALTDMAPSLLDYFDVPAPEVLKGQSVWKDGSADK